MHDFALNAGEVDRLVESLNYSVVTVKAVQTISIAGQMTQARKYRSPLRQGIFDVIQGGVDEYAGIVPSSRLDANSLVNKCALGEHFVCNHDGCGSKVR